MEKTSFNAFLATIVLTIIAFLPPSILPLAVVKSVIIVVGILLSFIFYIISRIKTGSLALPLHPIVILGGLVGLSVIISSLTSSSPGNSFMGISFDQYSGAFILTVLLAGLLTVLLCKTRERVASVLVTIIGSFSLVALFTIIRLVGSYIPGLGGAGFLGLGTFSTLTSTMVGSWYDFAILAGVVFLITFFTLEFSYAKLLPVSKRLRIISLILCVVSFIFLVLIDLPLIWFGIALASLGLVIYRFFNRRKAETAEGDRKDFSALKKLPYFAIIVFVVATLFAWKGSVVSGPIIQKLNISYAEVSLPWRSTLDIAYPTLKQSPIFGAGPDRFAEQYNIYKPEAINQTQFWGVSFPSGSNFILTSFVDQGSAGLILWILLFGWFIATGIRALRHSPENSLSKYILTTSFLTTFFLWCMLFLYTPSHATILVTIVMTGLLVSVLGTEYGKAEHASEKKVRVIEVQNIGWSESWKWGRTTWLVLWLIALVSILGCFLYVKDAIAQGYFQSGINASVAGDVTGARAGFEKALLFKKSDTYYQALAQIDAYQINSIVSSATSASTTAITTIGSLLNEGIGFARNGQRIDPGNANNFLAEGDISAIAAALNVPNGYVDARAAYGVAHNLSPMNPAIYLSAARLDYAEGSTTLATNEINSALQLKPDYTDALFEAGVISYNAKDYQTAVGAFEAVLKVDQTYVNAEYFLGLTFARTNDTTDAITVFSDLAKRYPQNASVSTILSDLKAGTSIFTDVNQIQSAPSVGESSTTGLSTPPKVSALTKPTVKGTKKQ